MNPLKMLREYCSRSSEDGYKLGPFQSVPLVNYRVAVPSPARTLPVATSQKYVNLVARALASPHPGHVTSSSFAKHTRVSFNAFAICIHTREYWARSQMNRAIASRMVTYTIRTSLLIPIPGVLDWECAAFRPMWAEVAGVGWFVEDGHRMIVNCFEPTNFDGRTEENARLRAFLRTGIYKRDSDLFTSLLGGSELRAICDAESDWPPPDGQTLTFLQNYYELGYWNETRRGPFPWNMHAWVPEDLTWKKRRRYMPDSQSSLKSRLTVTTVPVSRS